MINLTRGLPPSEAFPIEDLIRCSVTSLQQDANVLLQYRQSPGYAPLRELLAQKYGVSPKQVFMANSSLEILSFIGQLVLGPGVRVFVESPSYDRANTMLLRSGAEVVGIPMEADGLSLAVFEQELKRGAPALIYVIPDFQNPTGVTTSLAKRKQLVAWAQQYNFWIIEDGPYRPLRYKGDEVPTIQSLAAEQVLHMTSLSKMLAPGLRMGFMIGPDEMVEKLVRWAVDSYIGPVLPTQGMVYEYLKEGLLEPNIQRLKELYRARMEAILGALDRHLPGTIFSRPEGGYYVSLMLPEGNSMKALLANATNVGLTLTDGRGFYLRLEDGERFLRIPFCSLTLEEIEEAVVRLSSIVVKDKNLSGFAH